MVKKTDDDPEAADAVEVLGEVVLLTLELQPLQGLYEFISRCPFFA